MRENLRKTDHLDSVTFNNALAASADGPDVDHFGYGSVLHELKVVIPAAITAANYWNFKVQSAPDDGTGSAGTYADGDAATVFNDANDVTAAGVFRTLLAGDSSTTIIVRAAYIGPNRFSRVVATKFAAAPNIGVSGTALMGHKRHQT